jgi:hypothetical protein
MRRFILSIVLALAVSGTVSLSSAKADWWSRHGYYYPSYSYSYSNYPAYSYYSAPAYSYYPYSSSYYYPYTSSYYYPGYTGIYYPPYQSYYYYAPGYYGGYRSWGWR